MFLILPSFSSPLLVVNVHFSGLLSSFLLFLILLALLLLVLHVIHRTRSYGTSRATRPSPAYACPVKPFRKFASNTNFLPLRRIWTFSSVDGL